MRFKFRKKKKESSPKIPQRIKDKRKFTVVINLTKLEKQDLQEMSRKVGLSMSAFVRECIFKKFLSAIKIQITGRSETSIERIKREKKETDPLKILMKKGFADCVKEIKQGFKEQREFLRPIPQKELSKIQERKIERLKELGMD